MNEAIASLLCIAIFLLSVLLPISSTHEINSIVKEKYPFRSTPGIAERTNSTKPQNSVSGFYTNPTFGIKLQFPKSWIISTELDQRLYADFFIQNQTSNIFDLVLQPSSMNLSKLQKTNTKLIYNSSGQYVVPFPKNTDTWVELTIWRSYIPSIYEYSDLNKTQSFVFDKISMLRHAVEVSNIQLQPITLMGSLGYKLVYLVTTSPQSKLQPTSSTNSVSGPKKSESSVDVAKGPVINSTNSSQEGAAVPISQKVVTDFFICKSPFIYSISFVTDLEHFQTYLPIAENIVKSLKLG
ncbi:MAG TPA: hypothetical protein VH500_17020 [Nitrososphaeraceae archaeon]|jgi:hypothetical protein